MKLSIRFREYKVFFYRLFLAYVFYFVARVLFYLYNTELLEVDSIAEFLLISRRGLAFDTTAILYINLLFIFLSLFPFFINTKNSYQRVLFWVYFITNLTAYATNFIDFIYYKFTYSRTTTSGLESVENEENQSGLLFTFLIDYWHVFLLFFLCAYLWIKLYKKVPVYSRQYPSNWIYGLSSVIMFILVGVLTVGGIRGDFKYSTRPINLVDAGRYVEKIEHADLVLNTPFAIIRTIGKNYFKKSDLVGEEIVKNTYHPIKKYTRNVPERPNVVILIIESYGREYIGAFNKERDIENYESYTPFVDSLAQHSLIFPNAFANGRKSIHAMSSILAGIPSFKVAFTSSAYANQKTQSLVSTFKEMDYDTSFFHGAPNGSMGFLGYGNILGFDHYYGMDEYKNKKDFDGLWGIWDKPFFNFMSDELSKKDKPFFATLISLSSHSPYKVPDGDEGKYPEGNLPIHKCVGYTDEALKEFFKKASKEDWYENTIFVLTADHCNQTYYKEYQKLVNRFAVPILFYTPNEKYIGEDKSLAQQIDIYPTLLDMVGYNKPFRSWGRSLIGDSIQKPFALTNNGSSFHYQSDSLIYVMDSERKRVGFYKGTDLGLKNKLNGPLSNKMKNIELKAKGFVQDYMNKIIDRKLDIKE